MHLVSMVTWFYGVCAWICVYTACMCSKNTACSEEENERMLKRWIHTNGPDSISVPLQHQDSCANRHEGKYRIMPEKSTKKKPTGSHKQLSLVSSLKSGRVIHPNASVFCSGSSQAPHHGRIGRTGPVQADCVLLQLLLLTSEHHHVHEQHMLKHCCHSWTNRTFVLKHEDRAETKTCLHKPNCSRGFYCPATLFLLHILFFIWDMKVIK